MEKIQVIQPTKLLAPYIKQYWFLRIDDVKQGFQRSIPAGCVALVFHKGNKIISSFHKGFIDKNKTEKPVFIDASKLGETIKIGKNQKTNLRSDEIAQIVDIFRNEKVVEQFSVTPSYEEVAEKGYSFSAGQYFDIKIEYVDITEEEFKRRMADYEKTLTEQFAESHRLENEIIAQLKTLKFNQ